MLMASCFILSGKRDSNSRPRPWQGRALPTELFPLAKCGAKIQLFSFPQVFFGKNYLFSSFLISFSFINASTGVKVSILVFKMSSLI